MDCVKTGLEDFDDKVFVIHGNDGSRVSCGQLQTSAGNAFSWHSSNKVLGLAAMTIVASLFL
jgi:hypothetical protein